MKKIVLATGNQHKLQEINAIAKKFNIEFEKINVEFNPIENGSTFEENSFIKAKECAKLTNSISLADDTGLCIEYLNGLPGLYSARYATTQEEKIKKILFELKDVPFEKRKAKFVCSMVLCDKNGDILHKTFGEIKGYIIEEAKGINGFGYDPIFFVENLEKTMAEMSDEEKNTFSHRAKALIPMLKWINDNIK